MTSICRFLPIFALLLLALAVPAAAHSRHPYSVEVLVDGVPLQAHHSRGKTYVEAQEGREYSIRLRNETGRRVAVALSVDGLNSIDAKTTTARKASKWILAPYQTLTIDGWQTGASTARHFFFTTEDASYGAWLGKTRNLGVISAAFFREKVREPTPIQEGESGKRSRESSSGDARSPSPGTAERHDEPGRPSDVHAATGIGRELDNRVRRVRFDAEDRPATRVELRYEYADALIALGVLPRYLRHEDPLDRREDARGFTDFDFAPAPPR
jgi:hypothetical protein